MHNDTQSSLFPSINQVPDGCPRRTRRRFEPSADMVDIIRQQIEKCTDPKRQAVLLNFASGILKRRQKVKAAK